MIRAGSKVGAAFGAVLGFFVMIPAMVSGGFVALKILNILIGAPVRETWFNRIFLFGGAGLGFLCAVSLLMVLGAVIGAGIASLVQAFDKHTTESALAQAAAQGIISSNEERAIVNSYREANREYSELD